MNPSVRYGDTTALGCVICEKPKISKTNEIALFKKPKNDSAYVSFHHKLCDGCYEALITGIKTGDFSEISNIWKAT